jgi:3-keto-5-aminohexanoate cleavage enzyme
VFYALSAYAALLEDVAAHPLWMIAGFSADVRPLIGETVARGGHVRVGLEDAPLGSKKTNLAWVEDAVRLVRQHGGDIASSADVRRDLQAAAGNA